MFQRFTDSKQFGFYLGLLLFVAMLLLPPPAGLEIVAWKTAAVAVLMATWWISEAIPIYTTALLPIVLFPVLEIAPIANTTAPYANPLIFLFMGGFIIAIAMQKWNLHRRIALRIVNFVGVKPESIIIGFIIASAFLSMWVSNTATALMMLPIAISVLQFAEQDVPGGEQTGVTNFQIVLVLSIAYACNIGGIGTLIGTPPNALLAGFMLENYNIEIGFAQWLMVGVPLMLIMLPAMFILLTKFIFPIKLKELPGGSHVIKSQLDKLGTITKPEIRVAAVFTITAFLWIFRPLFSGILPGLSDAGIAIAAGVSLFLIPGGIKSGRLLVWEDLLNLPWGILILFGGGLSLAMAISTSGLAAWIGSAVSGLEAIPLILLLFSVIAIVVFLTEITSNTATAAAFLPILASSALGIGQNPMLFVIPAAIAASCAFMLPVATPPNAIVYGSGKITIPHMAKAGLWLNIFVSVLLTLACYSLFAWVFGIEPGIIPEWAR